MQSAGPNNHWVEMVDGAGCPRGEREATPGRASESPGGEACYV
jgi:hypothetical protein